MNTALEILAILLLILLAWGRIHRRDWLRSSWLETDWYKVACLMVSLTILMLLLYKVNLIGYEEPKSFPHSRIDALIALGLILAFIGAIWAVWARSDADKAFQGTNKILNALGNSFEFPDILNVDKFMAVLDRIPSDSTTVSLYLGFPCIGLLYESKDNEFTFGNAKPKKALRHLTAKIKALQSNLENISTGTTITNFRLNICVLEEEEAVKLMRAKVKPENQCEKDIRDFYTACREAQDLTNDENKIEIKFFENFNSTEKLRFITVTGKGRQIENKAFVWIANITRNGEDDAISHYTTFDSKGFQTNDPKFIGVLETAFL